MLSLCTHGVYAGQLGPAAVSQGLTLLVDCVNCQSKCMYMFPLGALSTAAWFSSLMTNFCCWHFVSGDLKSKTCCSKLQTTQTVCVSVSAMLDRYGVSKEGEKRLNMLQKGLRPMGVEFRPESYKWSLVQVRTSVIDDFCHRRPSS